MLEVSDDLAAEFSARPTIRLLQDAVALAQPRLGGEGVEVCAVILLDARLPVTAPQEMTRGRVNSSLVHPRKVFRLAIVMNASSAVLAHNHRSGELTLSAEARQVTAQLVSLEMFLTNAVAHVLVPIESRRAAQTTAVLVQSVSSYPDSSIAAVLVFALLVVRFATQRI